MAARVALTLILTGIAAVLIAFAASTHHATSEMQGGAQPAPAATSTSAGFGWG
jgi:hypothetical protein